MLCDLRTRAVKSAAALLEHDEASAGLAPLVPALTKVALGAARQVGTVIALRWTKMSTDVLYDLFLAFHGSGCALSFRR